MARNMVRTPNGVAEVKRRQPFEMPLGILGSKADRLQKGQIVAQGARTSTALYQAPEKLAEEFFNSILAIPEKTPNDKGENRIVAREEDNGT